jgi:hypothetical protein
MRTLSASPFWAQDLREGLEARARQEEERRELARAEARAQEEAHGRALSPLELLRALRLRRS